MAETAQITMSNNTNFFIDITSFPHNIVKAHIES
jgi:hypothetical protein